MALAVWYSCILLELLLFRASRNALLRRYPLFFTYIACTFVGDIALFAVYRTSSQIVYQYSYWAKEFVCILAGYCLVVEILERTLAGYEGPRKLARATGSTLFVIVFVATAGMWLVELGSHLFTTSLQVERNLRSAELILLAVVISVALYYDLPIGKNLRGITIGYGMWVGTVVVERAIQSFAPSSRSLLSVRPADSLFGISRHLGRLALVSAADGPGPLADDYHALTIWTRSVIDSMRGHLRKAAHE